MQLFVAVGLQCLGVALAALIALAATSLQTTASLVIGGACCILPWALIATREALRRNRNPANLVFGLLVGEFAKVGLICALLYAAHLWLEPLNWPALVVGLIIALKMPLFALLYTGSAR